MTDQPSNMAEQAQRRAPVSQPNETPVDGSRTYEELRHLIVAPEQEDLAKIHQQLDDPQRRARDVSSVIAEAIQLRRRGDEASLAEALAPTVQETLRESVRKNPHDLADALFPVMGPAIRKSITETLRSMLESFNEALENSLSWRGIRWRLESIRTGKSFAEIVLMHSLLYRVEQVFLIHRETGLVLNHAVAPAVATQDASLVAGMLSAIQQFVHDSFESKNEDTLGSLTVGEMQVWIEQGPHAVVAAVIRGYAPAPYRVSLNETLEKIEGDYASALTSFNGDASPFRTTSETLHGLLEIQYRERHEPSKRPRLAIATVALLLILIGAWVVYVTVQAHRWSVFSNSLAAHPGIVVTGTERSGGRWHIHGFRDPLADDPSGELTRNHLSERDASFELSPFYSMDSAIVLRRAKRLLDPPPSITMSLENGSLAVSGNASSFWMAKFLARAPLIPGVSSIDTSRLRNQDAAALETTVLTFPLGQAVPDPGQDSKITKAREKIHVLQHFAEATDQTLSISFVGHTDSTGIEGNNMVLSRQRAERAVSILFPAGAPTGLFDLRGVGPSQPLRSEDTEEGRHLNRSVTFLVHFSPASPVH